MSNDLTPLDLGFPQAFPSFRPHQLSTALSLLSSPHRFSLLDAPTGAGKSLIYLTLAKLLNTRALILVGNKGLQNQLVRDFASIGLTDMRGQSNYPCVVLQDRGDPPPVGCDIGPCHLGEKCDLRDSGCHYYDAQATSLRSTLVVSNWFYWMTLGRYSDPASLGDFGLLIVDEAHSAPDALASFSSVTLRASTVRDLIDLALPPTDEGVDVWADWAKEAVAVARAHYAALQSDYRSRPSRDLRDRMFALIRLGNDLNALASANKWKRSDPPRKDSRPPATATDWVAETSRSSATFSPVWAHAYAEPYLWRSIPRVVLSSATLSSRVATYLGIGEGDFDVHRIPSAYPARRRPVVYIPTTRVDHRTMSDPGNVRLWLNRIDSILRQRPDVKGIIHTRSYARARTIIEQSNHRNRLITHKSTADLRDAIRKFKASSSPLVLVSPSVEEGFDFPGDECRFQVIAKVPFLDTRSPLMKARTSSDKLYSNYVTALTIVQQTGRAMRSRDDWCETFVIDDHWRWFRHRAKDDGLFPKWFLNALKTRDTVPPSPDF